jgi:hypothetical protein
MSFSAISQNTYQPSRVVTQNHPLSGRFDKSSQLSLNARNYLDYLESKFVDVNFIVGSARDSSAFRSDTVYNCFLCPTLLEEMANCTDTAAKYERVIWEMRAQIDDIHYGKEKHPFGEYIAGYAVEINDDGSVDYVLMLKDSIRGLHDKDEETNLPKTIKAKSADELFKTLDSLFEFKRTRGGNFDVANF